MGRIFGGGGGGNPGGPVAAFNLTGGAKWEDTGVTGESRFTDEQDELLFGVYKRGLVFGQVPTLNQLVTFPWADSSELPPLPEPVAGSTRRPQESDAYAIYEVGNGRIFVYGYNGRYDVYDPILRTWASYERPLFTWETLPAEPSTTNPLQPQKSYGVATTPFLHWNFQHAQLADGRVMVWGGRVTNDATGTDYDNLIGDAAIWNPLDNTWEMIAMPWLRVSGQTTKARTRLSSGDVVFASVGYTELLVWNGDEWVLEYDVTRLLVYDGASFSWSSDYSPSLGGSDFGAETALARMTDDRVMIIGGWNGLDEQFRGLAWNPANDTWAVLGANSLAVWPPPGLAYWMTMRAATLPDGRVLVTGGDSGNLPDSPPWNEPPWSDVSSRTMAEVGLLYDPVTDAWSGPYIMQFSRMYHSMSVLDGFVCVIGGVHQFFAATGSQYAIEFFDTNTMGFRTSETTLPVAYTYGSLVHTQDDRVVGVPDPRLAAGVEVFQIEHLYTTQSAFPLIDFRAGVTLRTLSSQDVILFNTTGTINYDVRAFKTRMNGVDVFGITPDGIRVKATGRQNGNSDPIEVFQGYYDGMEFSNTAVRARFGTLYNAQAFDFQPGSPQLSFRVIPWGTPPSDTRLFAVSGGAGAAGYNTTLRLAGETAVGDEWYGLENAQPSSVLSFGFDDATKLALYRTPLTGPNHARFSIGATEVFRARPDKMLMQVPLAVAGTVAATDVSTMQTRDGTATLTAGEAAVTSPHLFSDTVIQLTHKSDPSPTPRGVLSAAVDLPATAEFASVPALDDGGIVFDRYMLNLPAIMQDPLFPFVLSISHSTHPWTPNSVKLVKADGRTDPLLLAKTVVETQMLTTLVTNVMANSQTSYSLSSGVCRSPIRPDSIMLVGGWSGDPAQPGVVAYDQMREIIVGRDPRSPLGLSEWVTLPSRMAHPNVCSYPTAQQLVIFGWQHKDNGEVVEFNDSVRRYTHGAPGLWETYALPFTLREGGTNFVRCWESEGYYYLWTGQHLRRIPVGTADFQTGWEDIPFPAWPFNPVNNACSYYVDTRTTPHTFHFFVTGAGAGLCAYTWDTTSGWGGAGEESPYHYYGADADYVLPWQPGLVTAGDGDYLVCPIWTPFRVGNNTHVQVFNLATRVWGAVPSSGMPLWQTSGIPCTCNSDSLLLGSLAAGYYSLFRAKLNIASFTITSDNALDESEVFWSVRSPV